MKPPIVFPHWERDDLRLGWFEKSSRDFVGDKDIANSGIDLRKKPEEKDLYMVLKQKKEKLKPKKVRNIHCEICGELLIRIFPWCDVSVAPDQIFRCIRHKDLVRVPKTKRLK